MGRAAPGLVAAGLSSCGPLDRIWIDTGTACLSAEDVVTVDFELFGCWGVISAACEATLDGDVVRVTSMLEVLDHRGGTCSSSSPSAVSCPAPALAPGPWVLAYGGAAIPFEPPGSLPLCVSASPG